MSNDDPIFIFLTLLVAAYFAKMWLSDYRDFNRGHPHPKALPGATPTSAKAVVIGVTGALVLLAIETLGEYWLGISAEQSDVKAIALVAWITAAFVEELIFRGFLVVGNRGKIGFIASAVLFSGLFALAHPFLWSYESIVEDGDKIFQWHLNGKAFWSTAMVFLLSMWFYVVRFLPSNPKRSLIPCIAAHFSKNIGVFVIKLVQGHVVGWW